MLEAPHWDKMVKVGPVPEQGTQQGVADLLYEEKIWQSKTGLWFSPSGDWLAFATLPGIEQDYCCGQEYTQCEGLPKVQWREGRP